MYYPATTAGDAPRCNAMHFCALFALLRHGVHIFLATYTISNILYLLLFTNYDTLRKKLTRRMREGEGGATRGMVVVTKKERRRAKAVRPKMILPGMFERHMWAGLPDVQTFRVISSWARPLSHAFSLSSLPQPSSRCSSLALPRPPSLLAMGRYV